VRGNPLPFPARGKSVWLVPLPARSLSLRAAAPYARVRLLLTALGARLLLCSGRGWLLSALGAAGCCSLGALLLLCSGVWARLAAALCSEVWLLGIL
jgi:hypothetical protein